MGIACCGIYMVMFKPYFLFKNFNFTFFLSRYNFFKTILFLKDEIYMFDQKT